MKAYELLEGKSSAYIAKAEAQGHKIKVRIIRSKAQNDKNTWTAQIKVFAKGEKWMACHWFDCRNTIDEILNSVKEIFPHISFEKEIKTVDYVTRSKKAKAKKTTYQIKTAGNVGQPRTIETDKPLFEII